MAPYREGHFDALTIVLQLPDLFDLTAQQLVQLEGFAEKSATSLIEGIVAATDVELHRFLLGLGIPEVGGAVAKDLANHFGSFEAVRQASAENLEAVPGVGPITALAFHSAIDEPARFQRSRSVGAYFGLTPRRHASGEADWTGRISKCGDAMVRTYLFEAAGVLLTRVPQWCKLKA